MNELIQFSPDALRFILWGLGSYLWVLAVRRAFEDWGNDDG